MSIQKEVADIISGQRQTDYGNASESFDRIAKLWSAYLGMRVYKRDVANLMILLKVSRDRNRPKHDNMVDIIGYATLADLLNGEI
jgi:hypothetical protein